MRMSVRLINQFIRVILLLLLATTLYANGGISFKVTGLEGAALKNANDQLTIIAQEINKKGQNRLVIQHELSEVAYNVKQAVKPYGYFKATVRTQQVKNDKQWLMNVYVQAGPRVMVDQVNFTISGPGKDTKPYKRLLQKLSIKVGDPLNTEKYDHLKQKLFNLASLHGFFDAKMQKSQIDINLNTNRATITIDFATGRQYLFGRTNFSKNRLNTGFLQKYIPYREGEQYNSLKVQKLRTDLINSDYFNAVVVNTPIDRTYYKVPVDVNVSDRNSKHYIVGLGYGTDTGPRALLGFTWTPTNQWGHRFNVNLRAAQRNNYFTTNYIIPGKNPITDQYAISAGYSTLDIPLGQAYSKNIGFSYSTALGSAQAWQQTLMLQYLNERYNLSTQPFTNANVLMPSAQWTYAHSNKELDPTEGYRFNAQVSGASKHVLSKTSFFQMQTGIKYLYTFHRTHTRFVTRLQLGHTVIDNINNLPLSLQLLAGGADSVRGYSFQSIGPGRNLVVGSVELQQRIKGPLYVAGFFDFGSVANNYFENTLSGTGPALVWLSPVGALELSLAKPLIAGNHWRIQFSMGPSI